MSDYRYQGAPEERAFGPLPDGDYSFVLTDITEPTRSEAGNLVLKVKLSIQPGGEIVFANPWQGTDKNGNERDDIAAFLHAINRIPKVGEEPRWQQLVGARGRVRLKQEKAEMGALAGKMVNRAAFFHRPKEVGPTTGQRPKSHSQEELNQARDNHFPGWKLGAGKLDVEPDDIPF